MKGINREVVPYEVSGLLAGADSIKELSLEGIALATGLVAGRQAAGATREAVA